MPVDCKNFTGEGGCRVNKNSNGHIHGGCKVHFANQNCDKQEANGEEESEKK